MCRRVELCGITLLAQVDVDAMASVTLCNILLLALCDEDANVKGM